MRTNPGDHDLVAARGEALFRVLMTRNHPVRGFLFDIPQFLGDKKRTVDFYVEAFSPGDAPPHLFVQVKTTRAGYTARELRLRVGASASEMKRLAAYRAPTYIVGIDEPRECGYIVSANGESIAGFSSMSTAFPLTTDVLADLRDEVERYWAEADPGAFRSGFADPRWRPR